MPSTETPRPKRERSLAVKPPMRMPLGARFQFGGFVGRRIEVNQENWLLQAPASNPAMLQMFLDRDRKPRRRVVPWAGEFPGKYLVSGVQGYRLTREERLRQLLRGFVSHLVAMQDADGYLGPHPSEERLLGRTWDGKSALWDLWGHYHCMLGLLYWWAETGAEEALNAACRAADLLCEQFLDRGERMLSAGAEEMNLAVSHVLCLLYQVTGTDRYLRLVHEAERDWETPPAGDYVRAALRGLEFHQMPKPRWESLHDVQTVAELYFTTGMEHYREAATRIWRSIRRSDRHNTGAFSSAEQAVGNPYDQRAIETCCVIAWTAFSIDVLRMTGDSTVADEIELAIFNAIFGAQHPSGRWWTYNTPMDGVRRASAHEIVFQAHEGAPELNCCSVNGPRGIGMLSEWALMQTEDGVAVNFYGPSEVQLPIAPAVVLTLSQTTDYPLNGKVVVRLELADPHRFALRLRIPSWSRACTASVNGEAVPGGCPGTYLALSREWTDGDVVSLDFGMPLHIWPGQLEMEGLASIYRGPVLLAYDRRFNTFDPNELPPLGAESLWYTLGTCSEYPEPWLLVQFTASNGRELRLCDFATAGATGTPYRTWLPITGLGQLPAERRSCFASHISPKPLKTTSTGPP